MSRAREGTVKGIVAVEAGTPSEPSDGPTVPPVVGIAMSLAAYQAAIASIIPGGASN
jgi:hypothetical protein